MRTTECSAVPDHGQGGKCGLLGWSECAPKIIGANFSEENFYLNFIRMHLCKVAFIYVNFSFASSQVKMYPLGKPEYMKNIINKCLEW